MANGFRASRDVIIRTGNFAQALHFYEHVMGLEPCLRGDTLAGFETGTFRLFVEKGPPHGVVFDFLVEDMAAAKQALGQAGCVIVEEDSGVPRCYFKDPFGLVFNVEERKAG